MEPCAIVPLPLTTVAAAAFAPLAGDPPLARVVRSLLGRVPTGRLVVATAPSLAVPAAECLAAADLDAVAVRTAGEPGSRHRALTAGLEWLGVERLSSNPVLVADHRYPLATAAVADGVLTALSGGADVVVPVLPVTDTVKTVDDLGSVLGTVERTALRTVQFPRGYRASVLWDLVSGAADDDVDEFAVALRMGLPIGTVAGDANAFGVELPRDEHLLEAIIACRPA